MNAGKIIVLTDLHVLPQGKTIIGIDPLQRLSTAIAHINRLHPDAHRVVITGDLTHRGDIESYRRLNAELQRLCVPVQLMIGNHDNRRNFLEIFAGASTDTGGFVQSALDLGDYRLIFLDTADNGPQGDSLIADGLLCRERLDWLRAQLAGASGKKIVIFMHHPPHATGFPGMDRIGLRNGPEFYDLIARFPQVRQIIAGHVHRTISGSFRNVPFAVFKSPAHQQPMDFSTADSTLSVDEPGAYGILLLQPEGVIVHTDDFELNGNRPQSYLAPGQGSGV